MSLTSQASSFGSEYSQSFTSFAGSDIKAVIGTHQFAALQAVSYSVTREKAPIYTMGSPDARAFSRNKRGIAGSLIWVNFDRHQLLALVKTMSGKFVANKDDVHSQYRVNVGTSIDQSAIFNSSLIRPTGNVGDTVADLSNITLDEVSGLKELATPWYADQILPFDVTLTGTTETGSATAMRIYGVEILNEGSGISVDDTVSETQASFVARYVDPWQAVNNKFAGLV